MKSHIINIYTKCMLIALMGLCSLSSSSQTKTAVKGIAKNFLKREVKDAAKEFNEAAVKKAFAYGEKEIGKNYLENAVTKQTIRNIARRKVFKEIEEKKLKSVLQYSLLKSSKQLQPTKTSAAKMLAHNEANKLAYADRIKNLRKASVKDYAKSTKQKFESKYLSSKIKKTVIYKDLEAIIAKGPLTLSEKEFKQLLENPAYLRMYIKTYGGGNFQEFFIRLSMGNKEQVRQILQNPEILTKVNRMIRNGGGKHEWLMTKNFEDFLLNPKWGNDGPFLAMAQTRLVQKTERVIFKYGGKHGSTNSTAFHNGLAKVIQECNSKEELLVKVRAYAKDNLRQDSYKEFNEIFKSVFISAA